MILQDRVFFHQKNFTDLGKCVLSLISYVVCCTYSAVLRIRDCADTIVHLVDTANCGLQIKYCKMHGYFQQRIERIKQSLAKAE